MRTPTAPRHLDPPVGPIADRAAALVRSLLIAGIDTTVHALGAINEAFPGFGQP
ncbi:hypothetical protein RKE30_23810 [Streptomyces sp. Li-HN-5-11]|uniref:hypothetical protein n=1 Tax=Streptomyces sp. Li-HN-5-11 TaxID=3075432 RepID=UPI0028B013AE|nr:hypothetical protein [Streptomyces sp. Li-HN-5-11]WNM33194.1 hypothetical protein RKE30_23810 [Streptomyces sp. Li-HN-5-11]